MDPLDAKTDRDRLAGLADVALPLRSDISLNPGVTAVFGVVQSINGYRIIGRLGSGGMGTVWRAEQLSTHRDVALKVLNSSQRTTESAKRRFEREVEIAARLEHDHIAGVYDSGVCQDTYFYAMELIEGLTLDQYVQRNHPNRRRALELVCVICRAIQYAHQKGVIHRDLKPSNIIVDNEGEPHIVDFGLGKSLAVLSPFRTISIQGEWAGTPAYMSPEQAAGLGADVDTRSDIYSLGVILYELVTGRLPHSAEGGNLALLNRVVHDEIIRPRRVSPDIDRDLEAIILKTTAKRLDDRYDSAAALADDIENYLEGEPLTARQPTVIYFLRKKVAKHMAPIIVSLAGIMTLIGIFTYDSFRIAQERNLAIATANDERALRHTTERTLAENQIAFGDQLQASGHWHEAEIQYRTAERILSAEGLSLTNVELGILDSQRHSPQELTRLEPANGLRMTPPEFSVNSGDESLWVLDPFGAVRSYDLSTSQMTVTIAKPLSDGQACSGFYCANLDCVFRLIRRLDPSGLVSTELDQVNLNNGSVQSKYRYEGSMGSPDAMSANGRYLATTGWKPHQHVTQGLPGLWLVDLATTSAPRLLLAKSQHVSSVAFSPDMRTITTGDDRGCVTFWDVKTKIKTGEFNLAPTLPLKSSDHINCLAYTPDGKDILIGDEQGNADILSLFPRTNFSRLSICDGQIRAIAISTDGNLALIGDESGTLSLWELGTEKLVRAFHAGLPVESARFSRDGRLIAGCTNDGVIHIWSVDLADQTIMCQCSRPPSLIALSPDNCLAAVGISNEIDLFDTKTGQRVHSMAAGGRVISAGFSTSGSMLEIATDRAEIDRFDAFGQWKLTAKCDMRAGASPSYAMLIPSSSDLAVDITEKGAVLVNVRTREQKTLGGGTYDSVSCISFQGRRVLGTHGILPRLDVIDLSSGSAITLQPQHFGIGSAVAISPDEKTAFIAYQDGHLMAVDIASGHSIWITATHQQIPTCLSAFPDSQSLISGGEDGTLRLWDAHDGRELRKVDAGGGPISSIALSQDGKLILASNTMSNLIYKWDLSRAQ